MSYSQVSASVTTHDSYWSCSRTHRRVAGLVSSPQAVLMTAARTRPSLPGIGLTTRAMVHIPLGTPSSAMSTSPSGTRLPPSVDHFRRVISVGRYSRRQRRQNSSVSRCPCRHRFRDDRLVSENTPGGRLGLARPRRSGEDRTTSGHRPGPAGAHRPRPARVGKDFGRSEAQYLPNAGLGAECSLFPHSHDVLY